VRQRLRQDLEHYRTFLAQRCKEKNCGT